MPDEQNESKATKFATGALGIIVKRVGQITGAIAGGIADLLEKGAELPKGTAKQLHDAAKSLLDIEKPTQDAGGVSTFIHATATAIKGFIGATLELVRAVDIVALDNKTLNKIDEKFQEFNGDKSKFKEWLKTHPRINAYAIYYLSLMMLFVMGQKGYEEYFDKADMKPSKKAVKFINEELENSNFAQKIKNSPWLKSEENEIKNQIAPEKDNPKPTSDAQQVAPKQDNSKPNSDKKIVDNTKQKKSDFNKIAETLDESKFISKNKKDGRLYINFDYIRNQVDKDKTKRLAYLKKIQSNDYYFNRFRDTLVQCEGFEPDAYDIGDGHMTQGCGMTGSYPILPGQEVEEWMFGEHIRTTTIDEYAPITDFMGRTRSYNDLWQQMDAYCLDPGKNAYLIYKYILDKTAIKAMPADGFVAVTIAAVNNMNMAKQILKRLIDKKSPTGLTTDKNKIAYAFRTKESPERNRKEHIVYNGGTITDSILIGQHLPKDQRQTFSDAAAFLATNGTDGKNFNEKYDRQIHTAERTALFKMFYHIINPNNDRFYLNEDDFRQIESLNAKYGNEWEKYFDSKIKASTGKQQAKNKVQKEIILRILRNPKDAYKNTSKLLAMLKKRYAENDQNEADNAIMMAQLANTRGLGF